MALHYSIAAIPTLYNGRLYRSRLEARWAAFFDLCGWPFEYEPYDLGAWSPDFLLSARRKPVLVEVKPITAPDVPTIHKITTAADEAGFDGEILLLGVSVKVHEPFDVALGWLCSDECPTLPLRSLERAPYPPELQTVPWFNQVYFIGDENACDFCTDIFDTRGGSPIGAGVLNGRRPATDPFGELIPVIMARWAQAGNTVQWMPRRQAG